jgi:hypothetical protein
MESRGHDPGAAPPEGRCVTGDRLPENCFCLDSRMALPLEDRLFGHAITEDALVVGTEGLAAFRAARPAASFDPREGRFSAMLVREDAVVIRTDRTGQDALFCYSDDDYWAVGNSLALTVSEVARHRRLDLYPPGVQGFHVRGGIHVGEQPLSHRTMVEGIRILPATAEVQVSRATGRMRIVQRDPPLGDVGFLDGFDYEAELAAFIARGSGLLAAIAEQATRLRSQLSGGYDSRMVLALLLAGTPRDAFAIQSHRHRTEEYAIAAALCDAHGLRMAEPVGAVRRLGDDEALAVWELSCLGTYHHLAAVPDMRCVPFRTVGLTGDLAADWKFFTGSGSLNGSPSDVARGIAGHLAGRPHAAGVVEDFEATFAEAGIDPEAPWAMELYYNLTRSRFHCGRHWFRDLGPNRLVTPLTSSALMRLDLHAAHRGWDRRRVVCDILKAACPALAHAPFETPEKAFPSEWLDGPPRAGGSAITPSPFTIYAGDAVPETGERFRARRLARQPRDMAAAFRARFDCIDPRRLAPWFEARDFAAARDELDGPSGRPARALHIYSVAGLLDLIER